MSRAITHLLIGGLIIMTMGVPAATTANENDLKLTIVNPKKTSTTRRRTATARQ
jgi:hypothetical protein